MSKLIASIILCSCTIGTLNAQQPTSHIVAGPNLPARCSPFTGDIFYKTGANTGVYLCGLGGTFSIGPSYGPAGGALAGNYPSPTIATLNQDLLFTDTLFDIGKSGATRPRDIFLSRNLTIGGVIIGAVGSIGAPAITLGDLATGLYRNALNQWTFAQGGVNDINIAAGVFRMKNSEQLGFTSSGDAAATMDVNIARQGVGILAVGLGSGGTQGSIQLASTISGGTKFTASGCSISATTGGASAGKFTLGTNTCTAVVTMNGATGITSPNGWSCWAADQTAPTVLITKSSDNTTTASFSIPAGAGATDVIEFGCIGY